MGFHTFDAEQASRLEDAAARYRDLSAEELCWAVDADPDAVVGDLGSGTGFYTDDVAPTVGRVYAVDVQDAMHDHYREKGVPANVDLVTANVRRLPFDDDHLDAAYATMTYHEFASDAALGEIERVVADGGRFVVADWSADGAGTAGPPLDERYAVEDAVAALRRHGFTVEHAAARPETFLVAATND